MIRKNGKAKDEKQENENRRRFVAQNRFDKNNYTIVNYTLLIVNYTIVNYTLVIVN